MEGGLMKFLVRNARGKIVEDAEEKRDSLIKTFQVKDYNFLVFKVFSIGASLQQVWEVRCRFLHLRERQPSTSDHQWFSCQLLPELPVLQLWTGSVAVLWDAAGGAGNAQPQSDVRGLSKGGQLRLCQVLLPRDYCFCIFEFPASTGMGRGEDKRGRMQFAF